MTDEEIIQQQISRALGTMPDLPPSTAKPLTRPAPEAADDPKGLMPTIAAEGDERPLFEATYRADASKAVADLLAVVTARGAQYGSPEDDKANLRAAMGFGVDPIVGASIRANDKWIRLKNLLRARDPETGELLIQDRAHYAQVRDQYLDIAGYSIKCMEMLDELAEQEGWI